MSAIIDLENTYTSGVYGKRPIAIVRGQGALVWDAAGREYIDCTAGYGVANIGHARPEIAAALAGQALRLISCPELFYNDVRARLLERLAHLTPQGLEHIFLCNSGAEAVEGALKFARLATGRSAIVATLRGFHGRTMGALSATWEPHYREPFAPLVPAISHVRYNDLAAAEAAISEETAAVIIELVQGEGGVHVASAAYVQGLAKICRERGALVIVDEIQTGFGRTGSLFACNHYDLQPDILCLAKSLAGGVPIGAICLGPRVMESGRITRGVHGSSFGGNPLACSAALATLDIIEQEALPERTATLGSYALQRLSALRSPLVSEVRGRGLLLGIELTRRAQPYLEALSERGVLALQAGPNVIRLLPPLVITQTQLEQVLDAVEGVLGAVYSRGDREGRPGGASQTISMEEEGHDKGYARAATRAPALLRTTPAPTIDEQSVYRRIVGASGVKSGGAGPCGRPSRSGYLEWIDSHGRSDNPINTANPEISLLYNMLTIPSYSRQEGQLSRFLAEQAGQMGLHAFIDDVGNFIASTHPQKVHMEAQPIILLGHMDTVRGYIPVRLEGGTLYGRGAVDAKGPLAAFLCAAARLAPFADSLQHPIIVIGAVEEEAATSRGARAVVERYQPFACIIGEPSGSQAITIGYKGRLLADYYVARSISHSAGPQQNSSEVTIAFWNRLQQCASAWNEQFAANSAFATLKPSLRSIKSDQHGFEEYTRLLIGFRLPPGYNVAALRVQLEDWASKDNASLSFSGEEAAFQTVRTTPLARAFLKAIRGSGGQPSFKRKTGTSDMNVVGPAWGQNIVAYGPGDSHLDHTPQEHIRLAEYSHAIDVLEQVLGTLALGEGSLLANEMLSEAQARFAAVSDGGTSQ